MVSNTVSASHLNLNSFNFESSSLQIESSQQGILDRAIKKINQKEEQDKLEQSVELLQEQDNLQKAKRQAELLSGDKEEAQSLLTNMRMGNNLPTVSSESYDDQVKKIASQQDEYKDEYEGFGSLTEMIKHQDQMAENQAQQNDEIAQVKAKMTQALNNSQKKEKETSEEKEPEQQGPLNDQQTAQLIDEVSIEQDSKESLPGQAPQGPSAPTDESYDQGFIGKFTQKLQEKDRPKDSESSSSKEEPSEAPKRGLRARFEERVELDEKDQQKQQEVVQKAQHDIDFKKKSVLEQETENVVQEQHDDLVLELADDTTLSQE